MNHFSPMNCLIIGCGQLGKALAIALHKQGYHVTAISRTPKSLPSGIRHHCLNAKQLDSDPLANQIFSTPFQVVFVIVAPSERTLVGYQSAYVDMVAPLYHALGYHALGYHALDGAIDSDKLKHVVFISSTRVYGQNAGQVIDDNTAPCPSDGYGKILQAAELLYQDYFGHKAIIIRPSGLITSDGHRFISLAQDPKNFDECHYLNLIDRDDVVCLLQQLNDKIASNTPLQPSYIFSTLSVFRHDLLNQKRQQLGLLPLTPTDTASTGKRLNAVRLQQEFDSCTLASKALIDTLTASGVAVNDFNADK